MEFVGDVMEQVKEWAYERYSVIEDILTDPSVDGFYSLLYTNPHFPWFFVFQAVWICTSVKRHTRTNWERCLLLCSLMTFGSRSFVAFCMRREIPFLANPSMVWIFLLIWCLVFTSPKDFVWRTLNTKIFSLLLQFANALIESRESVHGIEIILRAFPTSPIGTLFLTAILSSGASFIWMLDHKGIRSFSGATIARNALVSVAYFALTQYPEFFNGKAPSKEIISIGSFGLNALCTLLDCIVYGVNGDGSIDITCISYILDYIPFNRNAFVKEKRD